MEFIIYHFDPTTRMPTGEQETVQLPEEVNIYEKGMESIWKELGREGPLAATFWEPPTARCLFDGHGWVDIDSLDAPTAVHLLGQGAISVDLVLELGLGDSVLAELELLVSGALTTYGNRLDAEYPKFEMDSWDYQLEEAKAVQSSADADAPILQAIADAEGRSVLDVAESVLKKDRQRSEAVKAFAVLANSARAKLKVAKRTYLKDKKAALQSLSEMLNEEPFKIAE